MIQKNYEKTSAILVITIIVIALELIFIIYLYENKIYNYKKLSSILIDNNTLIVFLNGEERKTIYKNTYLYIDDKKIKYEVLTDSKQALDNKSSYYELTINLKPPKKYKINDQIVISLKSNKIKLLEMFKLIWGGDSNS